MEVIDLTYTIKAPIEAVWRALTDASIISEWSGSPAVMDEEEGTEFKLWNGDIHGTNVSVSENDELVQDWYSGDWEEPSRVTFTLVKTSNGTTVHILHENVPESEQESIEEGWTEYYMDPLKEYVESESI